MDVDTINIIYAITQQIDTTDTTDTIDIICTIIQTLCFIIVALGVWENWKRPSHPIKTKNIEEDTHIEEDAQAKENKNEI